MLLFQKLIWSRNINVPMYDKQEDEAVMYLVPDDSSNFSIRLEMIKQTSEDNNLPSGQAKRR